MYVTQNKDTFGHAIMSFKDHSAKDNIAYLNVDGCSSQTPINIDLPKLLALYRGLIFGVGKSVLCKEVNCIYCGNVPYRRSTVTVIQCRYMYSVTIILMLIIIHFGGEYLTIKNIGCSEQTTSSLDKQNNNLLHRISVNYFQHNDDKHSHTLQCSS